MLIDNLSGELVEPVIGSQLVRINPGYLDLDHHSMSSGTHIGWYAIWFFLPTLIIMLLACWNPELLDPQNPEFWRDFLLSIGIPVGFSLASSLFMLLVPTYFTMSISSCRFDRHNQTVNVMFRGSCYRIDWRDLKAEFKESKIIYKNPGHVEAPTVIFELVHEPLHKNKRLQFPILLMQDEGLESGMRDDSTSNLKELWYAVCQFMEHGPDNIILLRSPRPIYNLQSSVSTLKNSETKNVIARFFLNIAKILAYVPTKLANLIWFAILKRRDRDDCLPGGLRNLTNVITSAKLHEILPDDRYKVRYKDALICEMDAIA